MGRDFRHRGGRGGRGGNRGNGGHRGNRQNFHNKNKNHENPKNTSWQTDKRLLETDVGITEFISDCKGFHGIIKSR